MKTSFASPLLSPAERAEIFRVRPNSRAIVFRASPPPDAAGEELLPPDFSPVPFEEFSPAIPPEWDKEIAADIAAHAEAIRAAEFDSLLENGPEDFSPDAREESEGETLPPDESEAEEIPAAVPAAPRRAVSAAPAAVATPPAAVSEFEALRLAILARRK